MAVDKFIETGSLKHIYKNELKKACFALDAGYSDSKDLAKRTVLDKILKDKPYKIAINSKYGGYQRQLASMVYNLFDKKTRLGAGVNKELAEELHKPIIKNIQKNESWCYV